MRVVFAIVAVRAGLFLSVVGKRRWWDRETERHSDQITVGIAILILMASTMVAAARPAPVTQFIGDRYAGQVIAPASAPHKRTHIARKARRHVPVPRPRHAPSEAYRADTGLSFGGGIRREDVRVIGGRPAGCPARNWCGCFLTHHLGMPLRSLWLARNWAAVGTNAGGPHVGVVVVWSHHVGIITGRQRGQWIVKSGNDGRRVRERPRSLVGAIAFRTVRG